MEEHKYQCNLCKYKYSRPATKKVEYRPIITYIGPYPEELITTQTINCCPNCKHSYQFTSFRRDGSAKYWMAGASAMAIPNFGVPLEDDE